MLTVANPVVQNGTFNWTFTNNPVIFMKENVLQEHSAWLSVFVSDAVFIWQVDTG